MVNHQYGKIESPKLEENPMDPLDRGLGLGLGLGGSYGSSFVVETKICSF